MTTMAIAESSARTLVLLRNRNRRGGFSRPTEPSRHRHFQREVERVDAEREPEHVELDALLDSCERADDTIETDLRAGTARRPRNECRTEVVLADRVRRQVGAQLRRRAQNVRDERVRVRARPDV